MDFPRKLRLEGVGSKRRAGTRVHLRRRMRPWVNGKDASEGVPSSSINTRLTLETSARSFDYFFNSIATLSLSVSLSIVPSLSISLSPEERRDFDSADPGSGLELLESLPGNLSICSVFGIWVVPVRRGSSV